MFERGGKCDAEMVTIDEQQGRWLDPQRLARVFGWFFVATFVTSISAYFIFYWDFATP